MKHYTDCQRIWNWNQWLVKDCRDGPTLSDLRHLDLTPMVTRPVVYSPALTTITNSWEELRFFGIRKSLLLPPTSECTSSVYVNISAWNHSQFTNNIILPLFNLQWFLLSGVKCVLSFNSSSIYDTLRYSYSHTYIIYSF